MVKGGYMAHIINDAINKIEGREPMVCNSQCKYWKFPHLRVACVLSEVFSVPQGYPCFEFKHKEKENKIERRCCF